MASIFKNSKIKENLEKLEVPNLMGKIKIVKEWHDDYHRGSLKTDKETSREQAFNRDFFIKILGYTEKPANNYTLEPKATTETGQLPDLILGNLGVEAKSVAAVVELKGASIPLDRPQRREGNMSPIQQAFKYKTQYSSCPFVIASNFYEIRLFQDNQLDYEIWNLDDLVNPEDNYFQFRKFYYLLCADNFVAKGSKSKTEELLSDIRVEAETISKKFYKEYHELRTNLLRSLYQNNEIVRSNIDFGIEKAQKIVDRVVFVCFCEDTGLLPEHTLKRVLEKSKDSFGSLWNNLQGFFEEIDSGSEKLEIPKGYNGGLFAQDTDLMALKVKDDVLSKLLDLGKYDFSEDLTVNILGHIFEQSISDLEEIKQKVQKDTTVKSKRKKDGIFYTPDYIVDYIVKNSLGKYLEEKEEQLKNEYKLKGDISDKTYEKREREAYEKYQKFLQEVRVLDPACGSGAFLVKVFDYLLAENQRVGAILGNLFGTDAYNKHILKNNIYGVDLNQESVEITKLSLWLKTAQKNKKLTVLDDNIKCGNSLIDDPAVAGDKAFNWNTEFKEIMDQGGFDVIVGNPPYVKEYTNKSAFDGLHNNQYYQGKMDLWYFFGAMGLDLLKEKGLISFIAPNNWITNAGASKFRNKVLEDAKILKFIDFGDYKVFSEAGIQTMIYVMRKTKDNLEYLVDYSKIIDKKASVEEVQLFLNKIKNGKFSYFEAEFSKNDMLDKNIGFVGKQFDLLLSKINKQGNFKLSKKEIGQGIVPPQDFLNQKNAELLGGDFKKGDGVFVLSLEELNKLNFSNFERDIVKPYYTTDELFRYYFNKNNQYFIIYTDSSFCDVKKMLQYPRLKEYLDKYKKIITSSNKPYGLHRARENRLFVGEKILSVRKCAKPLFVYNDVDSYVSQTFFVIKPNQVPIKYLLGLLNSKLIAFWLKHRGKMQGDMYQIDKQPLLEIPIKYDESYNKIEGLVNELISLKENLFDYKALLEKSISKNDFDREIKLKKEIEDREKMAENIEVEIDQMVYALYGLTDKEISVVEGVK